MNAKSFIPPTDFDGLSPRGGPRAGLRGVFFGLVLGVPLAGLLFWLCGSAWSLLLIPAAAAAGFSVRLPQRGPDGKIRVRPHNVLW